MIFSGNEAAYYGPGGVLRNGSFPSRDDLINKLMRFITDYDTTAKPFAWTYTGDPLKADTTRRTYAR